jgi:hypothetical protein
MSDRPKIHFFGKTQKYASEASIGFACMALKLLELPGTFTIEFEHDVRVMYQKFLDGDSTVMIVMPTNMDSIDFVTRILNWDSADPHVIVGRYVAPTLNWQTSDGIPALELSPEDDREVFAIRKYEGMPRSIQEVFESQKAMIATGHPVSVLAKNTFLGCVGFRKKLR